MTRKHIVSLLLAASLASAGCSGASNDNTYPGFTRRDGNIFLMENHCHALVAWHMLGVSNATLVHIDAHDDCRHIPDENVEALGELLAAGSYNEVFRKSDTGQFLNLQVKDADMLYDLGNFIYPAMQLGLVSDVYWIVPQPIITKADRELLFGLMKRNLPGAELTPVTFPAGGFELTWNDRLFRVITFEDLPDMPAGCLLDLDIDTFAFPRAMTEEHLLAQVNRNPEEVFAYLRDKLPEPAATTISASVWGGYLPLLMRPLADAAYDFYTTGIFPEDAEALIDAYRNIRTASPDSVPSPTNSTYVPAALHFSALVSLSKGDIDSARPRIIRAASLLPVYKKGLLDAAEALSSMGRPEDAMDFIQLFENEHGPTYNSLAVKALVLLKSGDHSRGLELSTRLTDWERNPYTLLIHGGALMASERHEEAEKVFYEILTEAPRHASAYFNIGLLRQRADDKDGAIAAFRNAIEARPDFLQALENLGHLLLKKQMLEEAEDILQKAVAINPFSVTSLNNLGLVFAQRRDPEAAIEAFQKGLAVSPGNTALTLNLAETLYSTGEFPQAKKLCEGILERGENPTARALLERITGATARD